MIKEKVFSQISEESSSAIFTELFYKGCISLARLNSSYLIRQKLYDLLGIVKHEMLSSIGLLLTIISMKYSCCWQDSLLYAVLEQGTCLEGQRNGIASKWDKL